MLPPMPRLDVAVMGLPPTLLAGEVAHCCIRLKNSGAMTLHQLSMAAAGSPAGACIFLESSVSNEDGRDSSSSVSTLPPLPWHFSPQGVAVFSLAGVRLRVGEELVLPAWFR